MGKNYEKLAESLQHENNVLRHRLEKSSRSPVGSMAELAAKEIYEKLDDLEAETGQAGMYAQDCRAGDELWIKTVAGIIGKHCR